MKSTSQWVSFQLQGESGQAAQGEPPAERRYLGLTIQTINLILYGGLVLLIILGAIIYFRLPD
jgi:hypothetical protein